MAEKKHYLDYSGLVAYDTKVKERDAQKTELPKKLTDLNNDGNFVQDANYVHTDNNYSDAAVSKLAGIAEKAEVNVISAVTVNGVALTPSGKTVNISVPTNNNSLENGAGYQTATDVDNIVSGKGYQTSQQVETAITGKGYQTSAQVESAIAAKGYQTAAEVATAISNANHLKRVIVDSLPATGDANTIYLIPSASSKDGNVKDEYMWIDSKWEKIGSSEADLSGYVKDSDIVAITTEEIDAIFNGA